MKRFVSNLALFLLIQLVIWVGVLWVYASCPSRPGRQDYLSASIDKQNLLEREASPRIVFVGGSNLAFGLDSAEIQRRLGYHPVNMGLHGGLGLDFMLNEVKSSLRSGDVVVLSPEYELFGGEYAGAGDVLYTALEQRRSNIKFLSWHNVRPLLDGGYIVASEIVQYDISCVAGGKDPNDVNDPDNVYRRTAFDEYGDVVAHLLLPSKITGARTGSAKIGSPDWAKVANISRAIADLNSFNDLCQRLGVKTFYSYPIVSQPYFEENKESIDEIATALNKQLKIPIIDAPEEIRLPLDNFFDTDYHLNRVGIQKRTAHLIEKLSERGIKSTPEVSQQSRPTP
jgi:hypothetical protein